MVLMQLYLGLLLPSQVMLHWQKKERRAFADLVEAAAEAERRRREERGKARAVDDADAAVDSSGKKKRGKGNNIVIDESKAKEENSSLRRRLRRPRSSPRPSSSSSSSFPYSRSAAVDGVILALGLQLAMVVSIWFALEELDGLVGDRKLWFQS